MSDDVLSGVAAAALGAAVCVAASPYLARLSRSVPVTENVTWWRGESVSASRQVATAGIALVLGALAAAAAGWSALLPAVIALALFMTPLVVIDLEQHRLPDRLIAPAGLAGALLLALAAVVRDDWSSYLRAVEGAAAVFAALFALAFISPRSFGFGDVKLGAVLGGYLGWFGWERVFWGVFVAFLLGAAVSVVLLATRRASMKTALAFGPMLVLGALLVLAI